MGGNRVGLHETMDDDAMHDLVGSEPKVLCVGHTHQPFIRRLNQRLVFNVGSVGMPFDGDARASYGVLDWRNNHWHAKIVRLEYDRSLQAREFVSSGFLDGAGPMSALIFEEFKRARPLLSRWHRDYEQSVSSGSREMDETVRDLIGLLPPIEVPT
jgi:diadenosine tetraphosphatase ApaH/serine/threonine PP2A family protein phosphatase